MKILVNTPFLNLPGGVANHYLGLKGFWTEKVYYNQIGRRNEKNGSGVLWLPFDVFKFFVKLIFIRPDFVILNPSIGVSAINRDQIFIMIAHIFGKKAVVFFHGFNKDKIKDLNLPVLVKNLNRCKCILVLANEFAEIIKLWGVSIPIKLTTTKVNDYLLEGYENTKRTGNIETLLFLARAERMKGLDIAIKTFEMLKERNPQLKFNICGTGNALNEAKEYVAKNKIQDVFFKGHVSGMAVAREFSNADIYILPTHAEGMATSVLEAMAFGLPIITRPVGGFCDFFIEGKMGYMLESFNPVDYAEKIQGLIDNPTLAKSISDFNHDYAKNHFLASNVAKNIENTLKDFI